MGWILDSGMANLSMYICRTAFFFAGQDSVSHRQIAEDCEGSNPLLFIKDCCDHIDHAREFVGARDLHSRIDRLPVPADNLGKIVELCLIDHSVGGKSW